MAQLLLRRHNDQKTNKPPAHGRSYFDCDTVTKQKYGTFSLSEENYPFHLVPTLLKHIKMKIVSRRLIHVPLLLALGAHRWSSDNILIMNQCSTISVSRLPFLIGDVFHIDCKKVRPYMDKIILNSVDLGSASKHVPVSPRIIFEYHSLFFSSIIPTFK